MGREEWEGEKRGGKGREEAEGGRGSRERGVFVQCRGAIFIAVEVARRSQITVNRPNAQSPKFSCRHLAAQRWITQSQQGIAPGAARRYASPRRWQFDGGKNRGGFFNIFNIRPRTGPQSAHIRWPAMAKLEAASVPIAQAAAPWDRQTDGSRYSKIHKKT